MFAVKNRVSGEKKTCPCLSVSACCSSDCNLACCSCGFFPSIFCCENSFLQDPLDRYFYSHLVDFYGTIVGKYTSPMDPMGILWDLLEMSGVEM